jgi:hypothetical protein
MFVSFQVWSTRLRRHRCRCSGVRGKASNIADGIEEVISSGESKREGLVEWLCVDLPETSYVVGLCFHVCVEDNCTAATLCCCILHLLSVPLATDY